MKLNFTYDLSANRILRDPEVYTRFEKMKKAGVETIYVVGYYTGIGTSIEDMAEAKKVLEDSGFSVGVLNVPLGHGGYELDPSDPKTSLYAENVWQRRVHSNGFYGAYTTCINDVMLKDSIEANRAYYDVGYRRFMNDDDLRTGEWGQELKGCFCDSCMEEFAALIGKNVTRREIVSMTDPELSEAWMDFQCSKVLNFLKKTTIADSRNGLMVMHNGDRRHGIDIPLLRREMPDNLVFRVGEGHFQDKYFTSAGIKRLEHSILRHLALVGNNDICYSETTVYPDAALSPENWIEKMRIEIKCGLRNLFLMSGSWFFTDPYWDALEKALPELTELAETTPIPEHTMPEEIWTL